MRRLADLKKDPSHKQVVWLKFRVRSMNQEGVVLLEEHPTYDEGGSEKGPTCDYGDLYVDFRGPIRA